MRGDRFSNFSISLLYFLIYSLVAFLKRLDRWLVSVFRGSFNFGLCGQQNPPRAPFLGHASTAASVLNNDDDWEALMEVTTTDEAEKIRALVGDKVMPTTDPNQCILCRRVLSCKSALQMHYRTHTGPQVVLRCCCL